MQSECILVLDFNNKSDYMKSIIKFLRETILFILFITVSSSCEKEKIPIQTGDNQRLCPFHYIKDFPVVEIELMGKKVLCRYVDGLYILEGDIVIKNDNDTLQEDKSQKAAMPDSWEGGPYNKWAQGKVFYYNPIPQNIFDDVDRAIKEISNKTGVLFIPLSTPESKKQIGAIYGSIEFVANNLDYSLIGRQGYNQKVNLIPGNKNALHEICHALGLMHEHSRPDNEITLNPNYTGIELHPDYRVWGVQFLYSSPFDIESVMMYPCWAGAFNNASQFYSLSKTQQKQFASIRKRNGDIYRDPSQTKLSSSDVSVLNQMYPKQNYIDPDVIIYQNNIHPTATSCVLKGEVIYAGKPVGTQYGICYR